MEKKRITPERIKEVIREVMNEMSPEHRSADPGPKKISSGEAPRSGARKTACSVAIGGDHGGFKLKETLKKYLEEELGISVRDLGTHSQESVDYPDFAVAVARAVATGECEKGIVIDTMGIGSSIAANKIKGVRAALCHDLQTAKNSRGHNDANVLALGSKIVNPGLARSIVKAWLAASFEGGRHAKRVQKIIDAERC